MGNRRGSVVMEEILKEKSQSVSSRMRRATLAHAKWGVVEWTGRQIMVARPGVVALQHHTLFLQGDGPWIAQRKMPCPGLPQRVADVSGSSPTAWSMDRWQHAKEVGASGFIIIFPSEQLDELTLPTTPQEKKDIIQRSGGRRPGPSGFKMAFI